MKYGSLMRGMRGSELSTRGFIPWFGLPQRRPYVHVVEALTKSIASQQPSLFREHNHALLRRTTGSTGAKGLAAARLTTSLEHSTLNAPMPILKPSVQPVLRFFLHMISSGAQSCTNARASDLPTTIGCTDAMGIGSSGAIDFSRTRLIQCFFELFLRVGSGVRGTVDPMWVKFFFNCFGSL